MGWRVITLTEAEIAGRWALSAGYTSLECGVIECDQGEKFKELLALRVAAWYCRQLSELPATELPTEDIASKLTLTLSGDGAGRVELPAGVLRVVAVEMDTWHRQAIITHDPCSTLAQAQGNRFGRGGLAMPVAVVDTGLSMMRLYTPSKGGRLTKVSVVSQPEPGTYRLTDAMLARLPRSGEDFFNELFLKDY